MHICPEDELLCVLQSGELETVIDISVHSSPQKLRQTQIIGSAGPLKNLAWLRVAVKTPSNPVLQARHVKTERTVVHKTPCKVSFQVQTGPNN